MDSVMKYIWKSTFVLALLLTVTYFMFAQYYHHPFPEVDCTFPNDYPVCTQKEAEVVAEYSFNTKLVGTLVGSVFILLLAIWSWNATVRSNNSHALTLVGLKPKPVSATAGSVPKHEPKKDPPKKEEPKEQKKEHTSQTEASTSEAPAKKEESSSEPKKESTPSEKKPSEETPKEEKQTKDEPSDVKKDELEKVVPTHSPVLGRLVQEQLAAERRAREAMQ